VSVGETLFVSVGETVLVRQGATRWAGRGLSDGEVWDALAVLRLRLKCKEMGILSVKSEGTTVTFRFAPNVRLVPDSIKLLTYVFKGLRFLPDGVSLPLQGAKVLEQTEEMVRVLEEALAHGKDKDKVKAR